MAENNNQLQGKKCILAIKERINMVKCNPQLMGAVAGSTNGKVETATERLFTRRLSMLPLASASNKYKLKESPSLCKFKLPKVESTSLEGTYKPLFHPDATNPSHRGKQIDIPETFNFKTPALPFAKANEAVNNQQPKSHFPSIRENSFANQQQQQQQQQTKRRHEGGNDQTEVIPKKLQIEGTKYEINEQGTAMNYGFVFNLAFALVQLENERKVLFKCNIPGCIFKVFDEKEVRAHFKMIHKDKEWNGFCGKCARINFFPEIRKLMAIDEVNHIEQVHISGVINKNNQKVVNVGRGKSIEVLRIGLLRNRSNTIDTHSTNNRDPRLNIRNERETINDKFCNALESLINVQPWLEVANCDKKSKAAAISMLHEEPLAALFKCMNSDCSYFSNDLISFRNHLFLHGDKSAYGCSYCSFKGNTTDSLTAHIIDEHGNNAFQCAFCFYRSLTDVNLITHAKFYHREKSRIVMIECTQQRNKKMISKLQAEAQSVENIHKFVPQYQCSCSLKFHFFSTFEGHYKTHYGATKCLKCGQIVSALNVVAHNETCLKLCFFQCVHCVFGESNRMKMIEHLANCHPSKFPMFCDRKDAIQSVDSIEKSLKNVEHKQTNMIVISIPIEVTSTLNLRDEEAAVAKETVVDNETSLTNVFSSTSSIFSDVSELESTAIAVLESFNTGEINEIFNVKQEAAADNDYNKLQT